MRRGPIAVLAVVVAVVGCASDDGADAEPAPAPVATASSTTSPSVAESTASPSLAESTTSPSVTSAPGSSHDPDDVPVPIDAVVPQGFERVRAVVTTADGRECRLCVWLADDRARRSQGLRFVDDLGPADGMAFVYPAPDTRTFTMDGVRIDLDIAFFDATGAYTESFAMGACPLGGCRRYPTPENISIALEVRPGSLPDLGIGPGSTFELTDLPCA